LPRNLCNLLSNLFYLYFQYDTLFSSVYLQCLGFLFPLHVSGLTCPSSGGLNCTCSQWYSPPLQVSLSCGRWGRTVKQFSRNNQRDATLHLVDCFYWIIRRCTDPWILNVKQYLPYTSNLVTANFRRVATPICRTEMVYRG
jgi:hypothetical protein